MNIILSESQIASPRARPKYKGDESEEDDEEEEQEDDDDEKGDE